MDEEDFPALAPSTTKEVVVAVPPMTNLSRPKKPLAVPAAKRRDGGNENAKPEPPNSGRKPVLPSVDTTVATSVSAPLVSTPTIVTPAIPSEATVPVPLTPMVIKQGPRMIRILSTSPSAPAAPPALRASAVSGISASIAESDTASNGGSSRPVSPPPNSQQPARGGKTKSAAKKERIAAARKEAEEKERERERMERDAASQAPVVGRMKKKGRKKEPAEKKPAAKRGEEDTGGEKGGPDLTSAASGAKSAPSPITTVSPAAVDAPPAHSTFVKAPKETDAVAPAVELLIRTVEESAEDPDDDDNDDDDAPDPTNRPPNELIRQPAKASIEGLVAVLIKEPKAPTKEPKAPAKEHKAPIKEPKVPVKEPKVPSREPSAEPVKDSPRGAPASASTEADENLGKTAAQLLAELQESGEINFSTIDMFKPITNLRWEHYVSAEDMLSLRTCATDAVLDVDLARDPTKPIAARPEILRAAEALGLPFSTPGKRTGLKGLSTEQQERLAILEARIAGSKPAEKFIGAPLDSLELDRDIKGTLEELEKQLFSARKETELIEKKLEKLVKRNKKLAGLA